MLQMRTSRASIIRLQFKKLSSGTVATKTVPRNAHASRDSDQPSLKTDRKPSRTPFVPQNSIRRKSSDSGLSPNCHRNKVVNSNAPSLAERKLAKEDILKDMAQIFAIQSESAAGPKYTVDAEILGLSVPMLIDSGSQVNIIPASSCPKEILSSLSPSSLSISAYNGSAVHVLGTFRTDIVIGQIVIKETPIHVTSHSFRPILGTPALSSLTLDFKTGSISNGQLQVKMSAPRFTVSADNLNLQSKPNRQPRRQFKVYSVRNSLVPPRSEAVIPVRIENSFADYGLFVTEPETALIANCRVAKSVSCFTSQTPNGVVRILNPTEKPIQIGRRRPIVTVAAVDAVSAKRSNCSEEKIQEIKIGAVPEKERVKLQQLLHEYSDVFASDSTPLGHAKNVEFDIETGNSAPVAQQKYRTPYFLRDEMRRIIDKNVENGLMEPCSSPWAAPTLLVRKSNGKWRLVCDYRRLNSVTTADSYPLPEIMNCVNELGESKYFTTTDLYSGFHQIPTTVQAQKKLAVITDFGQFTWLRMPMGAKNSPAVFQRMMDSAFRSMPLSSLVIYLDDILVHSKTLDEHHSKLKEMFTILRKNGLFLRSDKTVVACKEVNFCGFRIKDGVKYPNPDKVKCVREISSPKSSKEAQSVFGLLNYFRTFIPNFAKKAAAITNCYKKRTHFDWPPEAETSLRALKNEISDATLQLRIPCMKSAKFVLETDACDTGYAGVLFICRRQEQHEKHSSGCLRPVEFMSAQFSEAQRKYYIAEKELYAGKEAMRKWAHYLLGRPFIWHIDNSCLKWAHRNQSSKPRISSWLAEIANFDATTVLKPSSQMKVSDCLSRQFAEINAIRLSSSEVKFLQENDDTLRSVRNYVANDRWPNNPSPEIEFYREKRDKLIFGGAGQLFVKEGDETKLATPRSLVDDIMETYHNDVGHPGAAKTLSDISSRYIWPKLQEDVTKFTASCHECQISKPNLKPKQPPLGESETPTRPYQNIAFDLIGPLAVTDNENRYALVSLDLFSKRISAVALPSKSGELVQAEIERLVFANPVLPDCILTDNGLEFAQVEGFCNNFNIRASKSAPYHPQTNGAVERANQTLKQRLFEADGEQTWDQRLHRIVHAINSSRNNVTQLTPFQIETGYYGQNLFDQIEAPVETPADIRRLQQKALDRTKIEKASRVLKNAKPDFVPFAVEDLVLMKNHEKKWPRFIGPFKIVKVKGSGLSYDLAEVDGNRRFTRAVTELKPYRTRPVSSSPSAETTPPQASAPDQSSPVLSSARGAMLSDFFDFDNFPPLPPPNLNNTSGSLQLTPPETASEGTEHEQESDQAETSSSSSAESVIRRETNNLDNSTRSIIELPTEDNWNGDMQSVIDRDSDSSSSSFPHVRQQPLNISDSTESSSSSSSFPTVNRRHTLNISDSTSSTSTPSENPSIARSRSDSTNSPSNSPNSSSTQSIENKPDQPEICVPEIAERPAPQVLRRGRIRAAQFFGSYKGNGEYNRKNQKQPENSD